MMGDVMKEASFSLTEAYFAAGDLRYCLISDLLRVFVQK